MARPASDSAARAAFPPTRASAVRGVAAADAAVRRAAFDAVVEAYWRPAYARLRLRRGLSSADAADVVQGFFAAAYEKDWFAAFDPAKGRFRTFFRTCLDAYAANVAKAAGRLKRGGGRVREGFSFGDEEDELGRYEPAGPDVLERADDEAFARGVFGAALRRLRDAAATAKTRAEAFALFLRYDVEPPPAGRPTYAELAREFGLKPSDVVNRLAAARRDFRTAALDALRAVTATDDEFREEARLLFGVDEA